MSWEIPFAYQSRDQTLSEALECGVDRVFEGEDYAVFIKLLFATDLRVETMGHLEAHIKGLDRDGRRRLLDRTRKSAGLPTTGEVERAQALRRARADDPPRPAPQPSRDQHGALIQQCRAEGCEAMSTDAGGAIAPVKARRFWCETHLDLAEPGDLDDWQAEQVVSLDPLTGGIRFPEEDALAAEHYRREAEEREEKRRKEQESRKAEAERLRVLEEQQPKPEPTPGLDPFMALHQGVR